MPDPAAFAAHDAVRDLLAVNADLARLGNLLKLELDAVDGAVPRGFIEDVERLHAGIGETQDRLKACAVRSRKPAGANLTYHLIVSLRTGEALDGEQRRGNDGLTA